jgi:hypothetical protein
MNLVVINKQYNHSNAHNYTKLPTLPLASSLTGRLVDWIHWSYCHARRVLLLFIARVIPGSWLSKQTRYCWISPWSTCTWCRPRWQVIWSGGTGALTYEPATIQALWQNGFFGKGVVSRGEPLMLDDLEDTVRQHNTIAKGTSTNAGAATVGQRTRRRRKTKQLMPPAISTEKQKILFHYMMPTYSSHSSNNEPLWLSPEEVFFLAWQAGSLQSIDQITKVG